MKNVLLLLSVIGFVGLMSCNASKNASAKMPEMSTEQMQDFFQSQEGQDKLQSALVNNKGELQDKAVKYLEDNPETKMKVNEFLNDNPGAKGNLIDYVFKNPELKNQLIGWVTSNPDIMKKAMALIGM